MSEQRHLIGMEEAENGNEKGERSILNQDRQLIFLMNVITFNADKTNYESEKSIRYTL